MISTLKCVAATPSNSRGKCSSYLFSGASRREKGQARGRIHARWQRSGRVGPAPERRRRAAGSNSTGQAVDIRSEGDETVIHAHGHSLRIDGGGKLVVASVQGSPPRIIHADSDAAADSSLSATQPAGMEADVDENTEVAYLTGRAAVVQRHFEGAMGADDFMQRLEMALHAYGFNGENSIAMVNLCRDEVTATLKHRIEQIFGSSFSTNGLGGVLTCGMAGMGAGFSHSPLCATSGKERYVFFSFPHISINSRGEAGPLSRPGRPEPSCACGALIRAHNEIRSQGLLCNCKIPGVHEPLEPEYSILKQRIARRLRHEGHSDESVKQLTLVELTQVAERTITDDLEHLIQHTVDAARADYAVITGVQVHNWSNSFEDASPNLEFVAPTSVYVVVGGQKTHLDLSAVPSMTPRQMRAVAGAADVCNHAGHTLLREEAAPYAFDSKDARRRKRERLLRYITLMREEGLEAEAELLEYTLQPRFARAQPSREEGDSSVVIDQQAAAASVRELEQIRKLLEEKHRQQQQQKKAT